MRRWTALALCAALIPAAPHAAPSCAEDAMIVFDGSGSMAELDFNIPDEPRIVEAREAMRRAIPSIALTRRLGLLIYGPGERDGCSNIDLRFAPQADAASRLLGEVDAMRPDGMTPLTASVQAAAETLKGRGVVVLVTDGKETCGGAPCALGAELARQGSGLVVHVIGFKLRADTFSWNNPEKDLANGGESVAKCLADRTGGQFVTTETVAELVAALEATMGCPLLGAVRVTLPSRT